MAVHHQRVAVFAAVAALLLAAMAQAEIKLQNVERKINLNSQFARITETIKLKNTGSAAVTSAVLCYSNADKLAYQQVLETVPSKVELKTSPVSPADAPAGVSCVEVALAHALPAGETATLQHTTVFADVLIPFPSEIPQGDPQLVVFTGNLYVVSPYTVSAQNTEVLLASSVVKSYTDEKPVTKSDNKIRYGKYDLIAPFTIKQLRVHFENAKQFATALTYVKEIEVSHWGNIYVEEAYELKHTGAAHKGAFSRLKYMHSYSGKGSSFRTLKARLPLAAHSLYYVDLIGNISTSNVRKTAHDTIMEFDTRYPLVGGWKVDFKIGYSVPLAGFLFKKKSDGKHRLSMDLSTPLDDIYVKDMEVRVVLPEGATDIKTVLPFDVDQSFDTKYTYLDTTGRPVVVFRKANVVPEHASKFSVDYSFAPTAVLREPLMLITAFFVLFLAAIVYNRLEFTLTRDERWKEAQSREQVATVMEQIQDLLTDEEDVVAVLAKLTQQIRSADDVAPQSVERDAIEARLKILDGKLKPLLAAVEASSPKLAASVKEVVDKVRAVQARYFRLFSDRVDLAKKGVPAHDITKRVAATYNALQEAKKEVDGQLDALFAQY